MIDRPQDVMMRRMCQIRHLADGEVKDLAVDFRAPYPDGQDAFFGEGRLTCGFFSRRFRVVGEDEIQALTLVMSVVLQYMQHVSDGAEFLIYWTDPGDLNFADFWRYKR